MAKALTSQCLKCVLEYLEANKRIRICTRSPTLRKIERKIPLHLDCLTFAYASITLNNISFQLYSWTEYKKWKYEHVPYAVNRSGNRVFVTESILLPGDVPLNSLVDYRQPLSALDNRANFPIHLYFEKCRKHCRNGHRVPKHLEFHVAMKRLSSFLLGTRTEIRVKRLEVAHAGWQQVLRVPPGLKLSIQELEVQSSYLESLLFLINCKSMKSLKIVNCHWTDPCFELPIVQSVEKLCITDDDRNDSSWNMTLLKLPNRELTLDCNSLSEEEMKSFIQGLLDEIREIGTCYTLKHHFTQLFLPTLMELEGQFRFKIMERKDNYPLGIYKVLLPMSATTELYICGSIFCTQIEVVPITSEQIDQISAECSDGNNNNNNVLKKGQDGCWIVVFSIIFLLISIFTFFVFTHLR